MEGSARTNGSCSQTGLVGPDYRRYIPAANVDPNDDMDFLEAWARAQKIVPAGSDKAFLCGDAPSGLLPLSMSSRDGAMLSLGMPSARKSVEQLAHAAQILFG